MLFPVFKQGALDLIEADVKLQHVEQSALRLANIKQYVFGCMW